MPIRVYTNGPDKDGTVRQDFFWGSAEDQSLRGAAVLWCPGSLWGFDDALVPAGFKMDGLTLKDRERFLAWFHTNQKQMGEMIARRCIEMLPPISMAILRRGLSNLSNGITIKDRTK